jgi:GT2 family glycosyltransferase
MARRIECDKRLCYVREDRPGLANAHNAALPHITTEFVAFTDDDVLVEHRWLERLLLAFDGDEGIVCVTGMIAPRELETLPQQWVEGKATYDKGLQKREFNISMDSDEHPLLPYASGSCGSGANMAFRTAYLCEGEGFDPALGTGTISMGGDDLAAFYDVLKSGHRLVYEPAAIVLHPHHREYSALRRQTYGYGAGLGAHLTRCLIRDPKMLLVLLARRTALRARAAAILNPPAMAGLPPYPQDLRRQHLRGLLSGPGRYVRSQRHAKRIVQPEDVS